MSGAGETGLHLLIAHPSPDLYGSDRQLVETVRAFEAASNRVVVALPEHGPLRALLEDVGARTRCVTFPVLRKSLLNPLRLLTAVLGAPMAVGRLVRVLRSVRPDVLYVNTVTIPWWVVAGWVARVPVVVHVHEAEEDGSRVVRWLLTAPLRFATSVVANSAVARQALLDTTASLADRSVVIYNGIGGPGEVSPVPVEDVSADPAPVRLALVARLSPRKGVDVALEAVAQLRAQGRAVELDVCGTVFAGYEWFESQLRERAERPDLAGAVRFHGYVNPTWPVLADAAVVLVPSRLEPFGNTAVEGLLAGRPVVASRVQGLAEIVTDGVDGLLVPVGDPSALAEAVARVLDDPELAQRLADTGRASALDRFSLERYQREIVRSMAAAKAHNSHRVAAARQD